MTSRKLVAASTVALLMSVLARGESYGYAIISRVRELSDGDLQWTEGMVYPVLHRLEKKGWIASDWRESETGRQRRYYRLTDAGRAALAVERDEWCRIHDTLAALWGEAARA